MKNTKEMTALCYLIIQIDSEFYGEGHGNEEWEDDSYRYTLISIEEAKRMAEKDKTLSDKDFTHIEELLEDDSVSLLQAYHNISIFLDFLLEEENNKS